MLIVSHQVQGSKPIRNQRIFLFCWRSLENSMSVGRSGDHSTNINPSLSVFYHGYFTCGSYALGLSNEEKVNNACM